MLFFPSQFIPRSLEDMEDGRKAEWSFLLNLRLRSILPLAPLFNSNDVNMSYVPMVLYFLHEIATKLRNEDTSDNHHESVGDNGRSGEQVLPPLDSKPTHYKHGRSSSSTCERFCTTLYIALSSYNFCILQFLIDVVTKQR